MAPQSPDHHGGLRPFSEKIEQTLDSPPASADCEPLQHFGGKDETGDDQSSEELSDRQSRGRAMVIESSIVILRSTMFSNASLKIGYPPMTAQPRSRLH